MNFQYYTNSWAESRFSQATISPVSTNQNPLKSKVSTNITHTYYYKYKQIELFFPYRFANDCLILDSV